MWTNPGNVWNNGQSGNNNQMGGVSNWGSDVNAMQQQWNKPQKSTDNWGKSAPSHEMRQKPLPAPIKPPMSMNKEPQRSDMR